MNKCSLAPIKWVIFAGLVASFLLGWLIGSFGLLSTIDFAKITMITLLKALSFAIWEVKSEHITTISGVALAFFAYKALRIWDEELKGTDKYKILMGIRKKFQKLRRIYQEHRVCSHNGNAIVQGGNPLSNPIGPFIKVLHSSGFYTSALGKLWNSFEELRDSIDSYRVLIGSESKFLDGEVNILLSLIQLYERSIKRYCTEDLSEQDKRGCEAYLSRLIKEDDGVSINVGNVAKDLFRETQRELDSLAGFLQKISRKSMNFLKRKRVPSNEH